MTNKNLVIALVVIIILLLAGGGGYMLLHKSTGNSQKTANQTNLQPTKTPQQTAESLLDLVKMGKNLRCTFKTEVANGATAGTVYVSGQNIRADFSVTSGGNTQQTSMIKEGNTSYIWGGTLSTGVKMTVSLEQLAQNKQASQYVDPNQKVNYSCSPWNVDPSLFTLPTNVKFTDITSLMAPKTTGTSQVQTQTTPAADPCSQIADPTTKAACENALKQSGH